MRIALVLMLALGASPARADALDHLAEGGAFYGELRPAALAGVLKRLGADQLPDVQQLKKQVGGIDLLNPSLLAPSGLDVASPIGVAVDVSTAAGATHFRAAATLRDAVLFRTFLGAIVESKQSPLAAVDAGSPLGKAGVLATAELPDHITAIVRVDGDTAIVDGIDTWNDVPAKALDIARRYPLAVKAAFGATRGARRLFSPDAAVLAYADGRRVGGVLEGLARMDLEDSLPAMKAAERARTKTKRLAEIKKCVADWERSSTTFDDVALALAADDKEVRLHLGWGTQGGPALGGLTFAPHDDGGVDTALVGHAAPFMVALFAASATPFESIKRTGIYTSSDSIESYFKKCGQTAGLGLFVRSWPQAIGAALGEVRKPKNQSQLGPFAAALDLFGKLRNLIVIVRDATVQTPQFAVAATFDGGAETLIEGILGLLSATGEPRTIGGRSAKVFALNNPSLGNYTAALETLKSGPLLFTFADSEESLAFAYRTPKAMPGAALPPRPAPPIMQLQLDSSLITKLAHDASASAKPAVDLAARLQRLEAELVSDGDLFRLTVRAPLKQ